MSKGLTVNMWLPSTAADYDIQEYESSIGGEIFFTLGFNGLKMFVSNREELTALRTVLDELSLQWIAAAARKEIEEKEDSQRAH